MKVTQVVFFLTLIFLVEAFHLQAADSTNVPAAFQESWQTISNRWGSVALEKIKEAAEAKDVTAQYYLGIIYDDGIGVEKNPVEAFNWMKLAAHQGMARAQMNLGWMYENGTGVAQDYSEAAKFYHRAAEQGHAMAQNNLGCLYRRGLGVPEDQVEAVKWFQKSADQGERLGAENLAWMYKDGNGVGRNFDLADKWMRKALNLETAEEKYRFGDFLINEAGKEAAIYHQDTNRFPDGITYEESFKGTTRYFDAAEWYEKSAEQGYAEAQYKLADMYNTGQLGDDQRSNCIPWFLKAAAQGNAEAQAEIGKLPGLYPNSELLKTVNPLDSLKQAAEQDDLPAQFELARRYHAGIGVAKDASEAFKWMEKAAKHEISPVTATIDVHYYLGMMYETGEGVAKNMTNAYQLYLEAAVGGNKPDPFTRVGQMYENGEGVPRDDRLAAENYYQALQFGFFPTSDDTARCTAIENLLGLYVQGRGFPDDTNLVNQQLTEIKRNHPVTTAKGQFLFGEIYYQSQLMAQDLVEAAAWFRLAANQNLDGARKKLEQVELEMSSAQKEAANSLSGSLGKRAEEAKASYKQMENYRRSHEW